VVEAVATEVCAGSHPARVADPCPHAPDCGGCDWPHVDPVRGASLKAEAAAGAARATPELAARLAAAPVRTSPLAYRLRARLHWDPAAGRLGFFAPRSHAVASIHRCRILSPRLVAALPDLEQALARRCPAIADLDWLESLDGRRAVAALRPTRNGPATIEESWIPSRSEAGVVDGLHALTRSGQLQRGWGAEAVTMDLPLPLDVPVGCFFQVNRHLAPWLFARLGELAGERPKPTWDLHAGVGFLAAAVRHAWSVAPGAPTPAPLVLVEPFRPSAHAAQRNLVGARVAVGRTAEAFLARARELPREALVLVDPPRVGLSPAARDHLARWRPERVVMLACDPATWARDVAALTAHAFRLVHLELVDLFPSTSHVEVVAVLEAG